MKVLLPYNSLELDAKADAKSAEKRSAQVSVSEMYPAVKGVPEGCDIFFATQGTLKL